MRSGFGIVAVGLNLYVVGGNDGQGAIANVDCYNQNSGKWYKCPSMHEKRDELSVILGFDGNIYAIGGFGGIGNTCLKSCERYII